MNKGIIFDVDGTLWDSAQEIVDSWNIALTRMGEKPNVTKEGIEALLGQTMVAYAKAFLPQYELDVAMEKLHVLENYENEYLLEHGAKTYGDIKAVFTELNKRGYKVFIVSNCASGYIETLIAYNGLEDCVQDLECYGNTQKPKWDNITSIIERNKLDEYWYVGDTDGDHDACKKAGCPFVFASYGFGQVDDDVPVINAFEELLDMYK